VRSRPACADKASGWAHEEDKLSDHVVLETRGDVAVVLMDRPDSLNALFPEMLDQIIAAFEDAGRDDAIGAVVLGARGRAFSAGGDMEFLTGLADMEPFEIMSTVYRSFGGAARAIKLCPKPVVGAVQGPAVGAGCELAVACDIRLASEKAVFSEAWIHHASIPPLGGMFLLPRIVGLGRATEMIFTGRHVSAPEAERIGLVTRIVAHEDLLDEAVGLAQQLADGPRTALRIAKEGLLRGTESSLAREWDYAVYPQSMLLHAPGFFEGLTAFKEKRRPRFNQQAPEPGRR